MARGAVADDVREMKNLVGAGDSSHEASDLLGIGRPDLDWVALATGMDVPARRATDCKCLTKQLQRGLAEAGPRLSEAAL